MENSLSLNMYESYVRPEEAPRQSVLVVEDDITYRPLWEGVLRRINPSVSLDWASSFNEANILLEDSRIYGYPYSMVVLDIFLSGSKTGLDLWNRYSPYYGESMVIVSAIDQEKLDDYLSKSMERPLYLKKPLQIEDCDEVARYFLDME